MCFSNMYFGLQTGWISMMSLQASLLGYAVFRPFQKKIAEPFGPIENVVLQTTAVATATMPLAAGKFTSNSPCPSQRKALYDFNTQANHMLGFVGIIPALGLLTTKDHPSGPIELSTGELILWSLGVAFFGVFFAVPLRKQTIVREKLRFPSGTATAQMITLLHEKSADTSSTLRQRRRQQQPQQQDLDEIVHEDQPLLSSSSSSRSTVTSYTAMPSEHSSCSNVALGSFQVDSAQEEHLSQQLSISAEEEDRRAETEESWSMKLRALIVSFSLSSGYTLLSYFFPIIYTLPLFNWLSLNTIDFVAWEWYFTPSLSYIGQGIIMGLPTTLSMLLGCVIGWGVLSPIAYYAGWAPGPVSDWKTGSKGWILWISLGVMIAESIVSLTVMLIRTLVKATIRRRNQQSKPRYSLASQHSNTSCEDEIERETLGEESEQEGQSGGKDTDEDAPPEQRVGMFVTIVGLIVSTLFCVCVVVLVFGANVMPIQMTFLAVAVAMLLSVLAVRALGETDLNPVSGIGKISQVIFALVMPGGIAANLIAGGIAEAGAQQAGDLMQDLKTGHLLHASPKAQFYGQMIGSFFSAFVATGAYKLYTTVYEVPGPEFSVPTAYVWLDMSRLVNGHQLPAHVTEFVILFAFIFSALVFMKEMNPHPGHGWRRYIPQGIAFAIGMYNPPSFTLARVIGAYLGHQWKCYCNSSLDTTAPDDTLWQKYRRIVGKVLIIIVASGFVLGEGTFAIVNLILRAMDVPHF
ncbi:OPT oligopeptide transporter protein-domain-containing protein [Dichotomocladium elegans]|nr:OPT oligopeptide transporter protein-domain-containing protein [Dichotomocladium elegans]